MHTCQFHRFVLALIVLSGLAVLGIVAVSAWGWGLTAWIALAALVVSGLLVAGTARLHESWQAARWDAGQRLR